MNGAGVNLAGGNTYTLTNVRLNYTINVYFAPITYTITVNQSANGSITPYTFSGFTAGANRTYNITPTAGYHVVDVVVDGVTVGAVTSYTFSDILTDHTISATFAANQ